MPAAGDGLAWPLCVMFVAFIVSCVIFIALSLPGTANHWLIVAASTLSLGMAAMAWYFSRAGPVERACCIAGNHAERTGNTLPPETRRLAELRTIVCTRTDASGTAFRVHCFHVDCDHNPSCPFAGTPAAQTRERVR